MDIDDNQDFVDLNRDVLVAPDFVNRLTAPIYRQCSYCRQSLPISTLKNHEENCTKADPLLSMSQSQPSLVDLAWMGDQIDAIGLLCPDCHQATLQSTSNFSTRIRRYPICLFLFCHACHWFQPISTQVESSILGLPVLDAVDCLVRLTRGESYGYMSSIKDFLRMQSGITKESFGDLLARYDSELDRLTLKQRGQFKVFFSYNCAFIPARA
jgi:hypothetical protein